MCDAMPLPASLLDAEGACVHANAAWWDLWRGDWLQAVSVERRPGVERQWRSSFAAGNDIDLVVRLGSHSTLRDVRVRAHPLGDGVSLAVAEDVTIGAGDPQRRLQHVLEATAAGTWEWNVQTGEFRADDRWIEMLGWSPVEFTPRVIEDNDRLTHPDDLVVAENLVAEHLRGDTEFYECTSRMRHRDGHWVWVLDRGRVWTWTSDGKPEWMFGTHLDMTDTKRQEERLQDVVTDLTAAQQRMQIANDSGGIGVWEYDLARDTLLWDEQMYRLYGLHSSQDGPVAPEQWQRRVLREDHDRLQDLIRSSMSDPSHFDTEFRVWWPDGTVHHLRSAAEVVTDPDGTPRRFVGVSWDVTEVRTLAADLERQATHDELTGLVNRSEFHTALGRALDHVQRDDTPHTLLYLDLDQFRIVNDACGHAAGDRMLLEVVALLQMNLRDEDTLGRLGGDEFGIILHDCAGADALRIAERLRQSMETYRFIHEGRSYRGGASIGLVPIDPTWRNSVELIRAGDSACYCAKDAGRNRVFEWDHSNELILDRSDHTQWATRLGEALDTSRFQLFGQRIQPLSHPDPRLHAEVLLRLPGASGKILNPGMFLPSAVMFDLSTRIDRWVLNSVLDMLAGHPDLTRVSTLTVNLSARAISDSKFHDEVIELLADADPSIVTRLCLEISESASSGVILTARPFFDAVRELGVRIALDDFGSGLSSFSYLKSMSFDLLKIDGQFIQGLGRDPIDALSVRSFVELAGLVGTETVAEQVTDLTILHHVRELGIDYGQGFLFHEPEPLADLFAAPPGRIPSQQVADDDVRNPAGSSAWDPAASPWLP